MLTLVIMDGLGINSSGTGNAVKMQGMPYFSKLKKQFPYTTLLASGESVGLPLGVMGNSEVGHLNLGAGRVVFQDLARINKAIETGEFFENSAFLKAIEHIKATGGRLHLMGLCSNGGVHSHLNHLKALLTLAQSHKVKDVVLHLFLDGRDTGVKDGAKFACEIERYIKDTNARIGSLCGRVYAMDRESRYDRVLKAYNLLAKGESDGAVKTLDDAFADSYENGIFDEFFEPTKLVDFKAIEDGDSVIFFNFRADRAREITSAFLDSNFKEFETKKYKNLCFVTMTSYDEKLKNALVAFKENIVADNLSAIISKAGLKQFHISETTKYAHVTFFFNGGIEKANAGEDRQLIESENVISFAKTPKMKAYEITDEVLRAITDKKYDFILVNLSNADMVGHTGDLQAGITAVETVDKCAYAIALATMMAGGDCIITADHGNAEAMQDKNGNPLTAHTTNLVPFLLASEKHKKAKLKKGGALCNVAPTILQLLNIQKPETMLESLIKD